MTDEQREYLAEYQRLTGAYDPDRRLAECPDPDASELARLEVDFAIPVLMTQDQQRRLIELIDEITDSPWNTPAEGVHWMAGVGTKMYWSRVDSAMLGKAPEPGAPFSGEPTYDDSVFHIETCARAFVSDKERDRVVNRRAKSKPARPARDAVLEALRAVAEFWGRDPEAFGDDATVTSLAGRFARVADKCRKALAIVEAERMREEETDDRTLTDVTCPADRAQGLRRFVDRTGREWTEPRPGLKPEPVWESTPAPAGFREVTLKAFTDGITVVIPEQKGFWLPEETVAEGDGSHDCNANGCGWEHVLARFRLPQAAGGD